MSRRGRRNSFASPPVRRATADQATLSSTPPAPTGGGASETSDRSQHKPSWEWEAQAASRTRALSQQLSADLSEAEEATEFKQWINEQMKAGYGGRAGDGDGDGDGGGGDNAVEDIFVDLRDGTVLSRLLKFLERKKFLKYCADTAAGANRGDPPPDKFPWQPIVERPRLTFHVKQNLTQCFDFIKTYVPLELNGWYQ